ncbi:hypothetical protein M728_001102 [Ensifer sp. WSM1721]|uniref:hypothetical protein n=1 Tax=Ensifer sp. WSM1721 TaxID=1041159 RepID=UPI00047E7006|nr:hypothetical protein [Ensifer sp. WSM1721]
MQQSMDERLGRSPPEQPEERQKEVADWQIDPSESVTLFAIAVGAVGAVVGLVAGIAFRSDTGIAWTILNCFVAVLAGGSAGVVTGGTIGAAVGMFRGARVPQAHGEK